MQFVTHSPAETQKLAQTLYDRFPHDRFWCLYGELGAGKTAFAKGFGTSLGLSHRSIKSPTYTYIWEHPLSTGGILYHCDLYRLSSAEAWFSLGLHERVTQNDFVLMEWADRIADVLPAERLDVHFKILSSSERSIIIAQHDS